MIDKTTSTFDTSDLPAAETQVLAQERTELESAAGIIDGPSDDLLSKRDAVMALDPGFGKVWDGVADEELAKADYIAQPDGAGYDNTVVPNPLDE